MGKHRDMCWCVCVTPAECAANPRRERAHGNITRLDFCSCGYIRQTEINGGRANYGPWEEPVRVSTLTDELNQRLSRFIAERTGETK